MATFSKNSVRSLNDLRLLQPHTTPQTMELFCGACERIVKARLTTGKEIYPHRKDLEVLPFWKCDACDHYVGCHHKTQDRTQPLGCIPTKEISSYRRRIHAMMDELLICDIVTRQELYKAISIRFGRAFHTGEIRTLAQAEHAYSVAKQVIDEFWESENQKEAALNDKNILNFVGILCDILENS